MPVTGPAGYQLTSTNQSIKTLKLSLLLVVVSSSTVVLRDNYLVFNMLTGLHTDGNDFDHGELYYSGDSRLTNERSIRKRIYV